MINLEIATEPQHFETIRDIAHTTWPVTFGDILSPKQIDYMLEMMYSDVALEKQVKDNKHVFLLARIDQNYLGYVSYELGYKNSTKVKIHKIYILPSAQGTGLGRRLITEVSTIAKAAGYRILILNVNRDNKAIQFYENLGFKTVGHEDIDIGDGFFMNDAIMELSL